MKNVVLIFLPAFLVESAQNLIMILRVTYDLWQVVSHGLKFTAYSSTYELRSSDICDRTRQKIASETKLMEILTNPMRR